MVAAATLTGCTGDGRSDLPDGQARPVPVELCDELAMMPCVRQVAVASLPIPGTSLHLTYASDRVPGRTADPSISAESIALGGWSLDALPSLDRATSTFVTGTGMRRQVHPVALDGDRFAVGAVDGETVDVFDADGRAVAVYSAVTGKPVIRFDWGTGGLASVAGPSGPVLYVRRNENGTPVRLDSVGGPQLRLGLRDGHLTAVRYAGGTRAELISKPSGLLTSWTDPAGVHTKYGYDSDGRLISQQVGDAGVTRYRRQSNGDTQTVTTTTPTGATIRDSISMRADGSVIRTHTDATAKVTTLTSRGNRRTLTMPGGRRVQVQLAEDPRWGMDAPVTASVSATLRGTSTAEYGVERRSSTSSDPLAPQAIETNTVIDGNRWSFAYDPMRRMSTTTDPSGRSTVVRFDQAGRMIGRSTSGGPPVSYAYDSAGRVKEATIGSGPDARTWRYQFASGRVTVTDPLGRKQTSTHDTSGALVLVAGPGDLDLTLDRDANGELTAFGPPDGSRYVLSRDATGRVVSMTPPDGAAESMTYEYDAAGRPVVATSGSGVHRITYDAADRVTSYDTGTGRWRASYGGAGNLIRLEGPKVRSSFAYQFGELTSERVAGPFDVTLSLRRDRLGRPIAESINGGSTIDYSYDESGRLIQAGSLAIQRDPRTGAPDVERIGQLVRTWQRNQFGEPTGQTVTRAGRTVADVQWTRDQLGRVVTQRISDADGLVSSMRYTYDPTGRISTVARGDEQTRYEYDAAGNLLTAAARYDGQDALLERSGTRYRYDANGRLAAKVDSSGTTAYRHDARGALLGVRLPDGREISYTVDGFGRRVARAVDGDVTSGVVYNQRQVPAADLNAQGEVATRYVHADSMTPAYYRRNGKDYLEVTDAVGSPVLVIDTTTGNAAARIIRDPWGAPIETAGDAVQSVGFAGGLADPDTGLTRFGHRDYDPSTGRWIAPDPIGVAGGSGNLYSYVGADPVNRTDPSGLCDYVAFGGSGGLSIIGGVRVGFGIAWTRGGFGTYTTIGPQAGAEAHVTANFTCVLAPERPASTPTLEDFNGVGYGVGGGIGPVGVSVGGFGRDSAAVTVSAGPTAGVSASVGYTNHICWFNCPDEPATEQAAGYTPKVDPLSCDGAPYLSPCSAAAELPPAEYAPNNTCEEAPSCREPEALSTPTARADGDPHLQTADGATYDMQGVGEYVALASDSGDLQIQVRQEPVDATGRRASMNTAIAMQVDGDRLVASRVESGVRLALDGQPVPAGTDTLPHGASLRYDSTSVSIRLADGTAIGVLANPIGLDLRLHLPRARQGQVHGLLGPFTGRDSRTVESRDGTRIDVIDLATNHDLLYEEFAESWRVSQSESLFDYAPGESTETFTDRTYPARTSTAIPDATRAAAERTCRQRGLTGSSLAGCAYDIAITGDDGFARSTATAIALPPRPSTATPSDTLHDGDRVTGEIPVPGQVRRYDLDVGNATVLRLHDVVGDDKVQIDVVGPAAEDSPGFTVTSNYQYKLNPSARYRLEVRGRDDQSGPYSFRLVTAKERRRAITVGAEVSGRVDLPGRVELLAFQPTSAAPLQLTAAACTDLTAALVDDTPAPRAYSPFPLCGEVDLGELDPERHYLLVVWSEDATPADYTFRLTHR